MSDAPRSSHHNDDTHEVHEGPIKTPKQLILAVVFAGVATVVGIDGDSDAAVAIPIIGLTGMATVSFLAVWSLPGVIIGIGLVRRRPWARVAGIVVAILGLVVFCIVASAVSIYSWIKRSRG